jgi:hypothetical protein
MAIQSYNPVTVKHNSGQVMIFMIMVLVILSFVVLWNVDLHKILHLKSRSQNAGDAAALAAARWQGEMLNVIGDYNIFKAIVLCMGETNAILPLSDQQARLNYGGPMLALIGAQIAAKHNKIYVNPEFTQELFEHANEVRNDYPGLFPEPYPNCWSEYAEMLESVAAEGIAAAPDNTHRYIDYTGNHLLLNLDFYNAIASRNYCWFKFHCYNTLSNYTDYAYWPALPPQIPQSNPTDSEIFALGTAPQTTTISIDNDLLEIMENISEQRDILGSETISNRISHIPVEWRMYNPANWSEWNAIDPYGTNSYPVVAPVKEHYNYTGADAVIRIQTGTEKITPGSSASTITWTAAAKPFGYLESYYTHDLYRPDLYGLVLPAFYDVRLIPVDTSSMPLGGAYNLEFRDHIENHLQDYLEDGISALHEDCFYCNQLRAWEDCFWRNRAINWLNAVDEDGELIHTCITPGGPGGPGGGSRRGH